MNEKKGNKNPKRLLKSLLAGFLALGLFFSDLGGVPGLTTKERVDAANVHDADEIVFRGNIQPIGGEPLAEKGALSVHSVKVYNTTDSSIIFDNSAIAITGEGIVWTKTDPTPVAVATGSALYKTTYKADVYFVSTTTGCVIQPAATLVSLYDGDADVPAAVVTDEGNGVYKATFTHFAKTASQSPETGANIPAKNVHVDEATTGGSITGNISVGAITANSIMADVANVNVNIDLDAFVNRTEADGFYIGDDESVFIDVTINGVKKTFTLKQLKTVTSLGDLLDANELKTAFEGANALNISIKPQEFELDTTVLQHTVTITGASLEVENDKEWKTKGTAEGGSWITTPSAITFAPTTITAGSVIKDVKISVSGLDKLEYAIDEEYRLAGIVSCVEADKDGWYYKSFSDISELNPDAPFEALSKVTDLTGLFKVGTKDGTIGDVLKYDSTELQVSLILAIQKDEEEDDKIVKDKIIYNLDGASWEGSYNAQKDEKGNWVNDPAYYPNEKKNEETTTVAAMTDYKVGTGSSLKYEFTGWTAYQDGKKVKDLVEDKTKTISGGAIKNYTLDTKGDVVLKANWVEGAVEYTYVNGTTGTSVKYTAKFNNLIKLLTSDDLTFKGPKTDSVFAGWKVSGVKDEDGKVYNNNIYAPGTLIPINAEGIVFEAQWLDAGSKGTIEYKQPAIDEPDNVLWNMPASAEFEVGGDFTPKKAKKNTKAAYTFKGWSLTDDNDVSKIITKLEKPQTNIGKLTLYAVYAGKVLTVKYVTRGVNKDIEGDSFVKGSKVKGKAKTAKKAVYGEGFAPDQSGITANGYTLIGYSTKKNFKEGDKDSNGNDVPFFPLDTPTVIKSWATNNKYQKTVTLYPVFQANKYLLHVYSVLPVASGSSVLVEREDSAMWERVIVTSGGAVSGSSIWRDPLGYYFVYPWTLKDVDSKGKLNITEVYSGIKSGDFTSNALYSGKSKKFSAEGHSYTRWIANKKVSKKSGTKINLAAALKASTINFAADNEVGWDWTYPKTTYVLGWDGSVEVTYESDEGTAPTATTKVKFTNKKTTKLKKMNDTSNAFFQGWIVDNDGGVQFTGKQNVYADQLSYFGDISSGKITLKAEWIEKATKYDVHLCYEDRSAVTGGAIGVDTGSAVVDLGTLTNKGSGVSAKALTKAGKKAATNLSTDDVKYTFVKWVDGAGNKVKKLKKRNGEVTLYAVFKLKNASKIKFVANNPAGTSKKGKVKNTKVFPNTEGSAVVKKVNKYKVSNYTLIGYSWTADAKDGYYAINGGKLNVWDTPENFKEKMKASGNKLYGVWAPTKAPTVDYDFGAADVNVNGQTLEQLAEAGSWNMWYENIEGRESHVFRKYNRYEDFELYGVTYTIGADGKAAMTDTGVVTRLGYKIKQDLGKKVSGWKELTMKTGKWANAKPLASGQLNRYLKLEWERKIDTETKKVS